jgi:O-antigen/teichoic acid export membrane protein
VGRILGPAILGQAGMSLAIGLGSAQVIAAGIGPATTRFAALRRARGDFGGARRAVRNGIVAALVIAVTAALALLWILPPSASALDLPSELITPIALLVVLQSLYIATKAGLYGLGRVATYVSAETIAALAFVSALAVVLAGSQVAAIAPFIVANAAFAGVVAVAISRRSASNPEDSAPEEQAAEAGGAAAERQVAAVGGADGPAGPDPTGPGREPESMTKYALVATTGTVAAIVRLQLPPLVLGASWGAAEVGVLQAALVFLPLVLLLPRGLELALFPALSGSFASRESPLFRQQVEDSQHTIAVALAMVGGGLLICGPALLTALYGSDFASSGPVLDWIVIAAWAVGLAVPAVAALSGADRVAIPNIAGVLALVVSVLTWWMVVPARGAVGAAEGLAYGSLVILALPFVAAWHRYGLGVGAGAAAFLRSSALVGMFVIASRAWGVHWLPATVLLVASIALVELPRLPRPSHRPFGATE